MLKQKYFLADIFILSAEKQPIKLSWRKIVCLRQYGFISPFEDSDEKNLGFLLTLGYRF